MAIFYFYFAALYW